MFVLGQPVINVIGKWLRAEIECKDESVRRVTFRADYGGIAGERGRAGTRSAFSFGSLLKGNQANCDGNYPYGTSSKGLYLESTTDVGSYGGNA